MSGNEIEEFADELVKKLMNDVLNEMQRIIALK